MGTYTNFIKRSNPSIGVLSWGDDWYRNQNIPDLLQQQGLKGNYVISGGVIDQNAALSINVSEAVVKINGSIYTAAAVTGAAITASTDPNALAITYVYVGNDGLLYVSSIAPTAENFCLLGAVDANETTYFQHSDLRQDPIASPPMQDLGDSLRGGFSGMMVSSTPTDINFSIDITAGHCMDSNNRVAMVAPALVTKSSQSTWVAGSGNGGLLNGALTSNANIKIYAIRKDSDGSVDYGMLNTGDDIETYLPTGYSSYRLLIHAQSFSGGSIRPFTMVGDSNTPTLVYQIGWRPITLQNLQTPVQPLWVDFSEVAPVGRSVKIRMALAYVAGSTLGVDASNGETYEFDYFFPTNTSVTTSWSQAIQNPEIIKTIPIRPDSQIYFDMNGEVSFLIKEVTQQR